MRTECVTYNDVEVICEKLVSSDNSRITTRIVRNEIGRGSLSTISKYVIKWQDKNAKNFLSDKKEPPVTTVRQIFKIDQNLAKTSVQNACTPCTVVYSLILVFIVSALTRFLVIESAVFYEIFNQGKPFEMACLTEACLLICAFSRPSRKVYFFAMKAMMVAIIIFMMGVMVIGIEVSTQKAITTADQLRLEIANLEIYNQSLVALINDLADRSRITAAGKLQDKLASNHNKLSELRAKLPTLSIFNKIQVIILEIHRLGAILLNVLFAHMLTSMWLNKRRLE